MKTPTPSTRAKQIVNNLYADANKIYKMNITNMSAMEIASVLTGLAGFLVVGFLNDTDLCMDLAPAYQMKIMSSVNKVKYDNYSKTLNDSYVRFRETGIQYQYKSEDWISPMMNAFGKLLLELIGAEETDYSIDIANREVYQVYNMINGNMFEQDAFVSDDANAENERRTPGVFRSIFQVLVFVSTYELCLLGVGFIVSFLMAVISDIPILSWLVSGIGETVVYTFSPILMALLISKTYDFVFKFYYTRIVSAVICCMFVSYAVISHLIQVAAINGIISWAFFNQIWFDVILCGILFVFLYHQVNLPRVRE